MTAAEPVSTPCVLCGADTITLPQSGHKFCLSCGAEYDPADPPALSAGPAGDPATVDRESGVEGPSPAPPTFVTVVRVTGIDTESRADVDYLHTYVTNEPHTIEEAEEAAWDDAKSRDLYVISEVVALSREIEEAERLPPVDLADMVDTEVRLVDGRTGTIVGFPDDDTISVRMADDEVLVVDYDDVTGSVVPPSVAGPVTIDVPDDVGLEMAEVNLTFATLAIRAALRSLDGDAGAYTFTTPPVGWMPPDVDALPVAEQGVAYAIALLVVALGIPRADVEHVVDEVLANSETNLTKGESNDEQ